jgi:hypothetical protein
MNKITETAIERYTAEELESRGFQFLQGTTIVPDGKFPERQAYSDVILSGGCPKSILNVPITGRKIYE